MICSENKKKSLYLCKFFMACFTQQETTELKEKVQKKNSQSF